MQKESPLNEIKTEENIKNELEETKLNNENKKEGESPHFKFYQLLIEYKHLPPKIPRSPSLSLFFSFFSFKYIIKTVESGFFLH